ncbi:Hydantoinase B oxoprolinase-domain-containing [Lecanosticta acicola]|uniref:Hydantoinase B oxoprolinase-domain-containing n=1 Tax=Lecanosticta acicola TaxID=111012 RepID=A0AAI8Z5C0_9PEZI|nr:Hydantoinase B oxoprolinase-domain-containing [Lecanosticta acicola]
MVPDFLPDGSSGSEHKASGIRISIDRGGTFCDVVAEIPGQDDLVFKLLSVDPNHYADPATEAIRQILEHVEGRTIPKDEKLDGSSIESCRIGTTIATNALLEHKGEKFAFVTTKGFPDVCVIGDQTRPKLFDLRVEKAKALHDVSIEIDERVTIEDHDLNSFPRTEEELLQSKDVVKTPSGEFVRILRRPDETIVKAQLMDLRRRGYQSLAICLMHAWAYPEHEMMVAAIARQVGFRHVTTSHETHPAIKLLDRATAVCSEAYLYPIVQDYISQFEAGFERMPQRVEFMCSDGGLRQSRKFTGNGALLSGPAGGVVGVAQSCYDSSEGTPLIGFDMGGTSTDVCRYDGKYDFLQETKIADRNIIAPMLNIATVAAGGGSILSLRNGLLAVGPESAGAYPGPAAYRNGGPLTVTDANLFLGRLVVSSFPAIFGKDANESLDVDVVRSKFIELTHEFKNQTGQDMSPEDLALGFLDVANEAMSRPIRNTTEARGYAPEKHHLVSFGGAGGQHACAIADKLCITTVLIHKYSSLLSAYGISRAQLQHEESIPFSGDWSPDVLARIRSQTEFLRKRVEQILMSQGARSDTLEYSEAVNLRYFGTDTSLTISQPADEDYGRAFVEEHRREFAFTMERRIVVDSIKVRGLGSSGSSNISKPFVDEPKGTISAGNVAPTSEHQPMYMDKSTQDVPVYRLANVQKGCQIHGPALVIDETQTVFVEPTFTACVLKDHLVVKKSQAVATKHQTSGSKLNAVALSVFAHRFMAIAEQMGNTLQRTSISSSIRERLDFSCAIFSPEGKLVANAPHIPIHLGSMQFAIQAQHRHWEGRLKPGDVLLTNHPEWGGTHLPDLTVVTPCFVKDEIAFYVASRGHHTDIGGKGITSMMPESKELWEEGISVESMKIASGGIFLEDEVRAAFDRAGQYPGCAPTRRIQDNLSDLKAQMSANQRGLTLIEKLCSEAGLPMVHQAMEGIQANAEFAVRSFLRGLAEKHPNPLSATDHYDDGTPIHLTITIEPSDGSATFDFSGTGPQIWGNFNSPISITHSAVIYVLRCLLNLDIPLNEGCLAPITIEVPKNSILNPGPGVAICGSTIASQRVVDTILKAFGVVAAFQGCASSLGWGIGGRDHLTGQIVPGWNFGEAIGGGCGAGPGWHGEHATQVHSTNTRMTDPEVVEKRTQVLVRKSVVRGGSGGKGKWCGGNGVTREIEARMPMKFSILSDRRVFAPYGMVGGDDGLPGKNVAFRRDGTGGLVAVSLGGKAVVTLDEGEYIQINTPGGGGWGKPEK